MSNKPASKSIVKLTASQLENLRGGRYTLEQHCEDAMMTLIPKMGEPLSQGEYQGYSTVKNMCGSLSMWDQVEFQPYS